MEELAEREPAFDPRIGAGGDRDIGFADFTVVVVHERDQLVMGAANLRIVDAGVPGAAVDIHAERTPQAHEQGQREFQTRAFVTDLRGVAAFGAEAEGEDFAQVDGGRCDEAEFHSERVVLNEDRVGVCALWPATLGRRTAGGRGAAPNGEAVRERWALGTKRPRR